MGLRIRCCQPSKCLVKTVLVDSSVCDREASAECLPLRSNSVALVSAVNAIQWFDQDAFFSEVRRVLVENGVLFVAMHHLRALLEPGMDNWLFQLRKEKFSDYLLSRHMYWDEGYDSIKVPFKGVRRKTMLNKSKLTVSAVMDNINTWSLVIMMREQEPARAEATLAEFRDRLLSKTHQHPGQDAVINVAFMTSYVMCRK
ncbi:malonyl-[acyl-carrier protein] O-methyltransferase-like [Rhipicephalus sanguineus]|uniref:malonyl-[acyl-carrier protein] O-methyltransferase-like n=1 Tax=Rhipicephalus sanguineus TaxID=34632 RepID=UPI0020C2A9A7|nr:malonyl-[acyl-carrier protein] O-methyltransferase-like [Rhipicephalus sanguineus]